MPIKRMFWSGNTGRDIHVLRGSVSRDLTHEALRFQGADDKFYFADDYLVQFADVTLTFTPLFKGSVQGLDFVGDDNGISVSTSLGSVVVDDGINVKNNFIIEVKATNDTGDKQTFNETIRVHVHASVTQVWLTPDLLTIRPPLVAWKPRTNYTVGESLLDVHGVRQSVAGVTAPASKVDVSNNVLTLTVTQRFTTGAQARLVNFTAAAFLNGKTIDIKSATGTQITADFTHADFSAVDSGDVTANDGVGLSGNGPAPPAFATDEGDITEDNQIIWRSRGSQWTLPTNYRFSVRAQFDDNVVGDITDQHGVTWNDPHVEADGTITLSSDDVVGSKFFVGATLPLELGGATTPLGPSVEVGRAWLNEPSPPKVTLVAGGGLPRAGTVEDAPNILMLGDGFRSDDDTSFDQIVDAFVTNVKTNPLTTPYNLLSSRINFWKAFAPADQIGVSFRSEMYTYTKGGILVAKTIRGVAKPPAPGKPWALNHVLYAAGLPVPSDGPGLRTPADIKADWAVLLDPDPSPNISDDLVKQWQQVATRSFIEERDGFPGMSYGVPPAANTDTTYELDLHEERAGVAGLRSFYRVLANDDLKLADGRDVGVLWAEPTFRFDNTDLVLIISSFPGGRAVNGTGYMALSPKEGDADIPVKPVTGRNALALDLTAVPTAVEADRWHSVAHELGHSFGLGDEYVDFDRQFPEDHADASQANLQTEGDTRIPDPTDPTKKIISGDQIPWVWHRIIAATVVNGDIVPEGIDTFRIPVEPDVSFRFVKDDELLLRPRVRGQPLRKFGPTDISKALIVLEAPKADSILVRSVGFISAQRFPAGSLLFKPKPAPASVASLAYPFAEMVAKNIKDAITANKMPLTVVPCVMDDGNTQIPILDTTGGRQAVANLAASPTDRTRIVGLYAGGALSSCGIFHPTGQCMMRNSHDAHSEFCAVCRYIMVDMIAPEFHPEIDAHYDNIYPLK